MIGWRQSGFEFAAVKSGVRGVLQDITGTQRIAGSDLQILIIITIQGEIGAQPGRDVRLDTAFEGFERLGIDRERRHASHVEHTAFEAGAVGRVDLERKRVASGKSVYVSVDLGGRGVIQKNTIQHKYN